ncbi:polysaccharide deacetylase family protein [Mesorhizobium sp. YR577]|uniref:polysaccharide deacetylase family protein n=1 Tax=Mesorhizobium sp. YR577 TaxID=1884373 RepID=UPI0008E76CF0|nr:polysaccharide deacetylase family protein [Mesorhizobium sp. YR577]SFU22373.1 Peptidoglycan/xylan/chitin deacetylase, PgdA/CDA1 family [Mesorhizobium sp. YR577]
MTIQNSYFDYPHRGPGMDQDRYGYRRLAKSAPVAWTDGSKLLLWVMVHLEHFPMDMPARPFIPTGGMNRPGISVWDYTQRDYGNRVGIFRLMKLFDKYGIVPTVAMNSQVAVRYPFLLDAMIERNWEIAASGVDMSHLHYGGMPEDKEREQVEKSFADLRRLSGQAVTGWHSPSHSQSQLTPDLVEEAGGRYIADWINDDMPYAFKTRSGSLTQMPLSYDLSDKKILYQQSLPSAVYAHQTDMARQCLRDEADTKGARILSLSLSPWVAGQPAQIKTLDRVLGAVMETPDTRSATGAEIVAQWKGQSQ